MTNLDFLYIQKHLPHRHPFIFIDKIIELRKEEVITCKNTTINEAFFAGHFEDIKIFPGVLIIEAIAQSAVLLFTNNENENIHEGIPLLYRTDIKFLTPVFPGDVLIINVKTEKVINNSMKVSATVKNDEDSIVCKGKLSFVVKMKNYVIGEN
ncbi:3-hydroxyacyl-ACP dehydratase FabZ [Bacillus subtilis]|uniref:3-hydroxyacyl-ACP dehydratase FabZ n=1 Tax=Bacillus TaxID=1386 RepID=UPI00155A4F6F|nr:3-hydroxyacyl-ACP dehydratase FabZ [Bacillus velezensis]NLS89109.1 beta-hydroxyacyl-ACP dehydratase [Bacillus subtilis]UBM45266.1 3-hydroxyacyl-ACP dehydratase FabZ [Bacillus velezensis]